MKLDKNGVIRISFLIAFIVIMTIFYFVFLKDMQLRDINLNEIGKEFQEKKMMALFIIFTLYILKPFMPFLSTSIQLIFTALIFPWHWAFIINTLGMTIQMYSGYFMGALLGKDFMENMLKKSRSAKMLSDKYLKENTNTIFVTHLVPIFPFDVISMYNGAVGSNLTKYVLISMLGLAPRILAFTLMGLSLFDPFSFQFIFSVSLVVVISVVAVHLFNKNSKELEKIANEDKGEVENENG